MKTKIDTWEDLDFTKLETRVFQVQRRIFRASQTGDYKTMHHLQQTLLQRFHARCWAVHLAAEMSTGKNTAGVDGQKSLTGPQKLKLAQSLRLSKQPDPVRRLNIPKPGSQDTRPLGIPTIADRALQNLIKLALEPEWEARFTPSMFGFRRGRSCHDALISIRLHIQRSPKWVLDGDIEKFFDRLDHDALLKKLDTFPALHKAIRRILKAGMMEGEVCSPTELGTPQGGPLSPLLANIALCGLEDAVVRAFPPGRVIDGKRIGTAPRLIVYADDFQCFHESRAVIDEAHRFIDNWLRPLGLNLSPTKTGVTHTLHLVDGQHGFDFLGCHISQHAVGKHQVSPFFNGVFTRIAPSTKSQKRIYATCAGIIEKMVHSKKRNAEFAHRKAKGEPTAQELLIYQLNRKLKGWSGYFRHHNSKRAFSILDHKLFTKLWRWTKRRHPNWSRKRLVDEYFDGGNPWRFKVPGTVPDKEIVLIRVASNPITRHILVRSKDSFFNGNWAYWGKRQGTYPGIPIQVTDRLKRQHGKCWQCKQAIGSAHRVLIQEFPRTGATVERRLVHDTCSHRNRGYPTSDPFAREEVVGSPVP